MTAVVSTTGLQTVQAAQAALLQGQWAIAAGTSDAITVAYPTPNTLLTDGLLLGFRSSAANVTTTPTFAPDQLPAAVIVAAIGVPLVANSIPAAGFEALVRYNLANNVWVLLNPYAP